MKLRSGESERSTKSYRWRSAVVLGLVVLGAIGLAARAVELQLVDHGFLAKQGDDRSMRVVRIAAHRGAITDRNGEPLALSTPVDSIWVNPQEIDDNIDQLPKLAKALKEDQQTLARRITSNLDREFLYLVRHMPPDQAARIKALGIPGVYLLREYRRYYPAGEVAGHVVGFTTVDDKGQEGLELGYEQLLNGEDGAKRVIQDSYGRYVENVESIRAPRPGRDLVTSIDLRIQYLAYRELKAAMQEYQARAGSVIVIDVDTGEVLAMVNQPSYNPNDREQLKPELYRNRAATDIFEPGSSIKPFIMAAALASGQYRPDSVVDTSPGFIKVGAKVFEDEQNLGSIDLATILAKSSNVGSAKVALSLQPEEIWSTLTALGLGHVTGSNFPGESAGMLSNYAHWRPIGIATLSHGYGLSVTPLQLAHAYATIGAGGIERPVTFEKVSAPVAGERVLDPKVAHELVQLMEQVVEKGGTATRASLVGYRVSGKTGTAFKSIAGGYSTDKIMAVFAGLVPASHPKLATVVVIDEPSRDMHEVSRLAQGGTVAAPVFATVMSGTLRLLDIAPDDLQNVPAATLVQANDNP
ncbi:MAG TPA: penicillin-binding transpeptidase domain-containing protein [Steroidobacteraceae bacterium]|nr:penicillin-binding transpeptidase domain-containing protein [Steroidobacteraceae bacterium]